MDTDIAQTMTDPFAIYAVSPKQPLRVRKHQAAADIDTAPMRQFGSQQLLAKLGHGKWFIVFAALVYLVLLGRSLQLQIGSGGTYKAFAEGNRIHTNITKALRGVIYDHNGNLLVKNIPNFTLEANTRELSKDAYVTLLSQVDAIANRFQVDPSAVRSAIDSSRSAGTKMIIREQIPYSDALQYMVEVQNYPGLSVETLYSRDYLAAEPYGHILGYTGKLYQEEYEQLAGHGYQLNDTIGKTGVEKTYESLLRGVDGTQQVEVDYRGFAQAIIADTPPEPGRNLVLGIDSRLQQILYTKLAQYVEEHDLPGASAVALDPSDGSIRALVSYPSFDSNWFVGGIDQDRYDQLLHDERNPLFHKAIAGEYPSGSTFKPIVAAAGLEDGLVTPATTVLSSGGITINDQYFFPDWKAGGHGVTNLRKALAESVNTYFYLLGGGDNETTSGLGVERITEYSKRFGLGQATQVDLPGESDGFLPSKAWKEEVKDEPWYLGDTYHLSIGQGDVLATPLQIANLYASIANGGTVYAPHVVSSTTAPNGSDEQPISPTVLNEQVVSASTIREVQAGLRETVLSGSARSLQALPVSSAGKTGTAQFGVEEKTHSWFAVYAPYENPEIALAIVVESGGGSNDAAVPLAREALLEYYSPPAPQQPVDTAAENNQP